MVGLTLGHRIIDRRLVSFTTPQDTRRVVPKDRKVWSIVSRVHFPRVTLLWLTRHVQFAGRNPRTAQMIHGHPGSEVPIQQLLDTIEKNLDSIAGSLRYGMGYFKCWIMTNTPLWQSDRH
jgi:hypothetical protein